MWRISIEPRTGKYVKGYGFLFFAIKCEKQLLDTGLNASKKVVHKWGEFMENTITGAVTNSNIVKQEPAEEIIVPSEKGVEILNKLRRVL